MKVHVQQLITAALNHLQSSGQLPGQLLNNLPLVHVERTRDRSHGDFASNIAMALAKQARRKPRDLAEQIVAALPASPRIAQVEIAGPGFINVFLSVDAYHEVIKDILTQGEQYGRSDLGGGQRVQVEFVSANPTGPLHVGHGRGAAFGATIADLLEVVGFSVQREYYVNDAGRQMDILATSVWLRYLEQCGETLAFPVNGYKGVYIREIASELYREHQAAYAAPIAQIMADVPLDEPQGGDKEQHIDALIERTKAFLGNERYRYVFELGLNSILDDIREDLEEFGVRYDQWYSERSLTESGAVNRVIEQLRGSDHIYKQDGALWFRASAFGDEKDRVVQRENGQTTYFASDIAYHAEKFERGFERVIDVWGADHHGYITRTKAALAALDHDPDKLDILLVQFAILYRGGVRAQMSTRAGEFVSLRDLRQEVGNDAARFFYVMRKSDQHLDFDLDLAKSHSKDNPVYYIQYAHARVCSVLAKLNDKGLMWDEAQGHAHLGLLDTPHEEALLVALSRYPEVLEAAALKHEPHQLAHYLRDLANAFHTYYNEHRVLLEEPALRNARLNLSLAVRQVINNGLTLLGVSAPEAM